MKYNNLVIKANNLIEGFMGMTHNEYKLTLYLISKIRKDDEKFRIQRISAKEFSELLKCSKENLYTYMKNTAISLLARKITVLYRNNDRLDINWFSYTRYIDKLGTLEVAFNNDLSPFLLKIDQAYTKFFLGNVRLMKSRYSIRIYELLKQYEKIGNRKIEIENLRMYLGIEPEEYKQYNDFKRRIILTSQRELKKYSDICFEYQELKESRKIIAIMFLVKKNIHDEQIEITSNTSNNNESLADKNVKEYTDIQKIISDFNSKYNGNLDYNLIKNLVKVKGLDCVKTCVSEFINFVDKANKVENTFYDFTKKYETPQAYTKGTVYKNMQGNKPIQATNYEQREYDDDFFNSLYKNFDLVKDELKK